MLDNKRKALTYLVVVLVLGYSVLMVLLWLNYIPEPDGFKQAAEVTTTPCYYFCGPWYTWLFTWLLVSIVAFGGGSLIYGRFKQYRTETV